jgi:uroporphyrinogen-III synthase
VPRTREIHRPEKSESSNEPLRVTPADAVRLTAAGKALGLRISPMSGMRRALTGLRVVSFESRRSAEVAELIRNHGGTPIQAPSMREIPLADQHEALAFGETLFAGGQDVVILLTGVGTRLLITTLATRWPRGDVVAALGRLTLVCRGPKPITALKEVGLAPALAVPEPNTWRDLLSALDGQLPVAGKRVAVQEYGARNEELLAGLRQRGAHVTTVPVYGWALPEDTACGGRRMAERAAYLVGRLLARRHLEPADDTAPADPLTEASPILAGLVGASVQGRVALGPRAGARVRRLGDEPDLGHVASRGPRQAPLDGFDLHANVWVPRNDRARLEAETPPLPRGQARVLQVGGVSAARRRTAFVQAMRSQRCKPSCGMIRPSPCSSTMPASAPSRRC